MSSTITYFSSSLVVLIGRLGTSVLIISSVFKSRTLAAVTTFSILNCLATLNTFFNHTNIFNDNMTRYLNCCKNITIEQYEQNPEYFNVKELSESLFTNREPINFNKNELINNLHYPYKQFY